MVRTGQTNNRSIASMASVMASLLFAAPAGAGDDRLERPAKAIAPLELPHVTDLLLTEKARRRNRRPGNIENHDFLALTPGLEPVTWPKNTDMRARIVTSEFRKTPVVGWIAENLYRSKKDNGWCVEADPGEGEYMVFYRYHPKR
jgi:hypothetical protein